MPIGLIAMSSLSCDSSCSAGVVLERPTLASSILSPFLKKSIPPIIWNASSVIPKKLKIREYSPENLKKFSEYLLDLKQDALVVGHSDTTAVLAGLLAGLNLGTFENDVYDRIYQVVVYKDKSSLSIFHSMFECN